MNRYDDLTLAVLGTLAVRGPSTISDVADFLALDNPRPPAGATVRDALLTLQGDRRVAIVGGDDPRTPGRFALLVGGTL